jgi:hypothetical protein
MMMTLQALYNPSSKSSPAVLRVASKAHLPLPQNHHTHTKFTIIRFDVRLFLQGVAGRRRAPPAGFFVAQQRTMRRGTPRACPNVAQGHKKFQKGKQKQ